jgi:Tfp pilus assembly PilM family ATPase
MSFNNTYKISEKIVHNFRKFFPIPKYLSLDPVAIDISPNSIRVMKLKDDIPGIIPVLHKEVVFPRKYDLTDKEVSEEDVDAITSVLRKLKQELKLKYVVASLPEQKTYIYRVKMPRETLSDVASAIRLGMEENVPLPVEGVNFDYKVIAEDSDNIDVVVSVFPKSVVRIYTDIFKKVKLSPISFESESSCIARSVIEEGDLKPYILIRMMEDRVNVAIVENGVVQFTSKISVSGSSVTSDFDGEDMRHLSQALNKTLIYWFTTQKEASVEHKIKDAVIVGKYALKDGLVEHLENLLKIDVRIGNVWQNCFSTDEYIPEIANAESLEYAVTTGLGLKALRYK